MTLAECMGGLFTQSDRLEDFDLQDLEEGKVDMQQLEEKIKEREAKNHAIVLEMVWLETLFCFVWKCV